MTLGLGREALVRIPTNDALRAATRRARGRDRRRPRRRAPADRHRGHARHDVVDRRSTRSRPSPTSPSARACGCTSTRPTPAPVAMLPERRAPFDGWERADSIVVNPHKWLFTPLDASLLLTRRMAGRPGRVQPRARVPAHARPRAPVRDYNEYTPQLGRRFRALKLWIQLRWFGLDGLRRRIDAPPRDGRRRSPAGSTPTRTGSAWRPSRSRRSASAGARPARRPRRGGARRRATRRSWTRSTAPARSSCRTPGWTAGSRSAWPIGNLRTEPRHVERAWALLREAAVGVSPKPEPHDVRFFATPDGAARLVRREPRDRRRAVARLLPEGDRPAERRLVGGRSTRRCASAGSTASARASTRTPTPAVHAAAQGQQRGARSTWRRSRR